MRSRRSLALVLAIGAATFLAACDGSEPGPVELVVVSTRDGDYALFGMSADGDRERRLSEEAGDPSSAEGLFFQTDPAWSPDGSRIAFASKRAGSFDLFTMGADGTGTRRLVATKADEAQPSWAPDGRRLVFSRGSPADLWIVGADGSGVRRLLQAPTDDAQPSWSPDGRWIAFARRRPGTSIRDIWLVRPDGGGLRQLTALESVSESPSWSPDGRSLAFATNVRNTQFDVYTVRVDGTGRRRVTVTADDSIEPAWSPDGTTIAYSEGGSIFAKEFRADPFSEGTRLTDAAGNDSSPEWRPRQNVP